MAFGPSLIRFLRRPSEAPLLSAGPEKAQTEEGFPVQSFPTLLQALATRCRNTCQVQASKEAPTFEQVTQATPLQAKAFELLGL